MEALLDLADALARQSDTPPRPDFPLPDELAAINTNTETLLVHKQSPEKKGLGWFALQPIPAGTVLMVAKPLAMAMDWEDDEGDEDAEAMDEEDEKEDKEAQDDASKNHPEPLLNSKIVLRLLQDLQKNPNVWTDALSELYPRTEEEVSQLPTSICGDDNLRSQIEGILTELKTHPQLKDVVPDIRRRLPLIVRYNVLSVETGPELLSHPSPDLGHASLGGVALYHKPSFFNHSARPNVARYAVGDVMWFVANQDISAGTEACISYIEHDILCESSYRRNGMLQMDFDDTAAGSGSGGDDDDDDDDEAEEDGPTMPVVDSEVQNELMAMDAFERLNSIQELLLQAQGGPTPNEGEEEEEEDDDDAMEPPDAGWFLCDFQNLLVLQAITLDGLGQTEEALHLWEECVEFAETQLPPLDESAIVVRVQAALCALHLGDNDHIEQAKEHANKALTMHDKLFGGGVARLRRRYQQDFQLPLRSGSGATGMAAVDVLWPLAKKTTAKRAQGMAPASSLLCLFAIVLNVCSVAAAFAPSNPSCSVSKHHRCSLHGSLTDSFEKLSRQFEDCSVPDIQKMLVQKGADFQQQQETNKLRQSGLHSSLDKVPGCVANVHVKTKLRQGSGEDWDINFEGTADALLSRGLLAVLTTAMSSTSNLQEILSVDPYVVADQLGIRRALSPGRNDGVASMTQIIQQQIESLLLESKSLNSNSGDAVAPLFVDETATAKPVGNGHVQPETVGVSPVLQKDSQSPNKKGSVALLLSGGVDSSVALRLLLQEGYDVTAFYLKIWLEDELAHLGQCPWEDDYNVCRQVCEQAGVPLETFSLQEEYRDRVISYTIHEAQRGRTPNPDILCNSRIKFGCFYEAIEERKFDFVASGHYARLQRETPENPSLLNDERHVRLFRAPDKVKDQSYFLCALSQAQLERVLFPIGHLEKSQVRELAEEFQLPNRHRADSQGLCFLGKVKFDEFLSAYLGERPGDIIDAATGDLLGRHRGVWFHTVGQRKGIGKVLNPLATSRGPWYVVAKDPDHDIVFCSNQYDEEIFASARSEFHVEDVKWVTGVPPQKMAADGEGRFEMKIRHGPRLVSGEFLLANATGEEGIVKLDQKDGGLAPGQYVVFYEGEECLGGGVISERHWAKFLLDRNQSSGFVAGALNMSS